MKALANAWQLRAIFYNGQTIKFYFIVIIGGFYKIFKFIWKNCFKIFILIIGIKSQQNRIENLMSFSKRSLTEYIENDQKGIVPYKEINETVGQVTDIGSFIEHIITSKWTVLTVYYLTYSYLKIKNPALYIANIFDKEMDIKYYIFEFIEEHFSIKELEESLVGEYTDLVFLIFKDIYKSAKLYERAGINYFLWGERYIRFRLNFYIFKQKILFRSVDFSTEKKENSIKMVKCIIDYSRMYPGSAIARYISYTVN